VQNAGDAKSVVSLRESSNLAGNASRKMLNVYLSSLAHRGKEY
jgi:hypothetical protein